MCVHEAGVDDDHLVMALIGEFGRVRLWHARVDRETGERISWLEALHIVANNPPSLDRVTAGMYRRRKEEPAAQPPPA